jgi:hypothetical protein
MFDRVRRPAAAVEAESAPAQKPAGPVRRRKEAWALAGVAGGEAPFPHKARIEEAFGRPIPATARTDVLAAAACERLGAEASRARDQRAAWSACTASVCPLSLA